mgnify:CR=1 FL=1
MKYLVLFCLLLLSHHSPAATVVPVSLDQDYNLVKEVDYLLDASDTLVLNEAMQSKDWQGISRKLINFGFIKGAVWLRFKVLAQEDGAWVLNTPYSQLDFVQSTAFINGQIGETITTGDLIEFSARPLNHPGFVFPFNLSKGDVLEVYLKAKSGGSVEVPLNFVSLASFDKSESIRNFIMGWVTATLVVMLFYNLFIFCIVRERVYLFYVICVFCNLVAQGIYSGTWFQYVWPNTPQINNFMLPLFFGLLIFSNLLFISEFLQLFKRSSACNLYFKFLLIFLASFPLLNLFLPYQITIMIQVLGALVMHVSCLAAGVYFSYKGEVLAKLFTLAWTVYIFGMLVTNFKTLGYLPTNWFTSYCVQLGSFVEVIILAMALAYRIEAANKEKVSAQHDSIKNLTRYQNLYRDSLSGQFQLASSGRLKSVNPAFYKMLGYDSEHELLSLSRETRSDRLKIDVDKLTYYLNDLKSHDKMVSFETQLTSKNEDSRWYAISMMGVKEDNGDIKYYEGSMISINELKENEDIKLTAIKERMEALEHLVVGVCHEMNTPLGVVTTSMSYLSRGNAELNAGFESGGLTKDDFSNILKEENEAVSLIESNLARLNTLIKKFRNISISQSHYTLQDFNMLAMVNEQLAQQEALLKNVTLVVDCPADITLNSYPQALSYIIGQFIENSVHHGFTEHSPSEITLTIKKEPTQLTLYYADNGKGISLDKQKEIFNPFYTTRRGSSENIGLGMFQVYNIVTQLLVGEVRVSDVSEGFEIVVCFPIKGMPA